MESIRIDRIALACARLVSKLAVVVATTFGVGAGAVAAPLAVVACVAVAVECFVVAAE